MNKLKIISMLVFSASLSFFTPQNVKAEGCSDYPFVASESKFIPKGDGLFSLQTTQEQFVRADSNSQVQRARKIAELRGKKAVSDFVMQKIAGQDSFDNKSIEDAVENPEGVDWSIEEAGELFESISSSSENLIRGIITIGSCYEPGKHVLVTVGIKPETIAAAGNVEASSGNPYSGFKDKSNSSNTSNSSTEDGTSSQGREMQPFNTAPGYSGIDPDF